MSTQNGSSQVEPPVNGTPDPQLDITKLHSLPSDQQDLFLLTFVSELRKHELELSSEVLPSRQAAIKKEVIKIIGLGAPTPSRIIRRTLGTILADIFERGSRQLLHETINDLLAIINAGKAEKDLASKHAASTCLGFLIGSAGDSAVSLHGLVVSSLLKAVKAAQTHAGFRASIVRSLAQVVTGLSSSTDEQVARDIWKAIRTLAAGDKSALVQRCACSCLAALCRYTNYFDNSNDFDGFKTTIWKVFESTIPTTRNEAAKALSIMLTKVYTDAGTSDAMPIVRKPKKTKKQDAESDEDVDIGRPGTPAASKAATSLILNLGEALKVISSHYCKTTTSNRARTGLAMCYKYYLESLPEKAIQERYSVVANHFFTEIVSHPTIVFNRYRLLLSRRLIQVILDQVVALGLLSESGQINAARWIINDVLKNYPRATLDRKESSKRVLVAALSALSHILKCLGPASSIIQDSCREGLFQVALHPSYTVQVHVARCLKLLIIGCPNQLVRCIEQALSAAKKEFQPGEGHSHRRCMVYATSIAAMLSTAVQNPLYGTIELFSSLFTFATDLLKSSASSELRLCATQIQVAWTIIGGLMTLGPSFVKVHLNQLLLLWRNALPPPLTQDNTTRRGHLEFSFLTHVRECALTALLQFLTFNSTLITADGSKRISTMLQNSLFFLDSLPNVRQTEDISNRLVPALQLQDFSIMLRRRILQCMTRLMSLKHIDHSDLASHADIVGMTIRTFTNPERPAQSGLESSLASSASNFEGIWDLGDNWGFGINALLDQYNVSLPSTTGEQKVGLFEPTMTPVESLLSNAASSPIIPALEYDATVMCHDMNDPYESKIYSPATACVTTAIQLFAVALPLQSGRIQESCLEQLATVLAQPMQREPGRRFSLQLNAATAVLSALAVFNGETSFRPGKLAVQSVAKITAEIVRRSIVEQDAIVRAVAAQSLGRLCYLAGTQFTNSEVKHVIDTIVANRDPHVRAGCALALGCIHSQVGAMAASFHLKNIIGVLLSLCSDQHPVVHFWALRGLAEVASSAGLSFSTYASSTLGLLAQLYSSDNHHEESASLSSSNVELEHPTPLMISNCVDAIINVLGPDLQDVSKARNLILTLIEYFKAESSISLQVQSYVCLRHISLYAPTHVQLAGYVQSLRTALSSNDQLLQQASVTGLENLVRQSASEVFRVAQPGLGDELWLRLDQDPMNGPLRNILRTWMQQTCLTETADWVQQCQTILSRTRVKAESKTPATAVTKSAIPDLADEEVAGFASAAAVADAEKPNVNVGGQEYLRWQTRDFAMRLMSEMLELVQNAMVLDQIIPAEAVLQSKVSDIVRVAFSASTATVVELRIWGLRIIDQLLKLFGRTPDPDFLEASLLEQYQAQISSALTPAFAADSNPELAAEAIAVCATFVATGIVTNADRMGRIFKVLATGLENLARDEPEAAIGDLKGLSSNAQSMLKMALLSGWAQLQLASADQSYLEEIVQPYIPKLAPLWLNSLQEFAALRFEPEISDTLGEYATNNLNERYASFDREVRLTFYQRNWLNLVDAIALLVEKDSDAVFDALDNKKVVAEEGENSTFSGQGKEISFREEPVAFFFILFGLAYEALVTQAREDPSQTLSILNAVKKILTPAVAGNAIYEDIVFTETTDTLDRLALTSTSETQTALVEIARNLSLDHVVAKTEGRDEKLSDDIDQLFELTRIIILVLIGLVPTLEDPPGQASRLLNEDAIALVHMSFQALVDVAQVFPAVIRADLYACIIHCFCSILATGVCQIEVVPRIMPVFRSFLQDVTKSSSDDIVTRLVRGCLHRMLSILSHAQRREAETSIICAKNTLLSITVLLTTGSSVIPKNDELVSNAIAEILDCLQDVGLAKIATSCVRSLLMTSPKTSSDETVAKMLWSKLLLFINDTSADDPESVKTALTQALTASVATLKPQGRYAALSMLIPTLLGRARQPSANGSNEDLGKECASRLLELAAGHSEAFRATVALLGENQRGLLEHLLRSAGVGSRQRAETQDSEEARPAIALRMDF